MKKIYLSGKYSIKYTLVDDEDYQYLSQFKWYYINGYARRNGTYNNKTYRPAMHREILNLSKENRSTIDHINHDTLDNRKENLRFCTQRQNCQNRKSKHNKHGFKGIVLVKNINKFCVVIHVMGKVISGGYFEDSVLAAQRYDQLARQYFGNFAYLNFPDIIDYTKVNNYLNENVKINTCPHKGIGIRNGKFRARIMVNKKEIYLGDFDNLQDAIEARKQAELKYINE